MTETTNALGTTWVDTRDMPWGSFSGLSIGAVKKLAYMDSGDPLIMIVSLPPGDLGIELPHRHEHISVYEHAYHLSGNFPHSEWATVDAPLETVLFREGYFLDRNPGSLHGNEYLFPDTGTQILCWRSGTGNWLEDVNADVETPDRPLGDDFVGATLDDVIQPAADTGIVLDRAGTKIFSTRDMPWEPVEGGPALARPRVLVRDTEGRPSVRMIAIPPGTEAVEELAKDAGDWEYAYLVEGELPVDGPDGVFVAKQGYFMTRSPGSPDGLKPAASSVSGAVLLQWRIGDTTWPFKD